MAEPNDYVAEAKAQISAADQSPEVIAAMMIAQALDRHARDMNANTEALDNNMRAISLMDENNWRRQNR